MASSFSLRVAFLDARDLFLGIGNYGRGNVMRTLHVIKRGFTALYALKDLHPEATWVCNMYTSPPATEFDFVYPFTCIEATNPDAKCYAALLNLALPAHTVFMTLIEAATEGSHVASSAILQYLDRFLLESTQFINVALAQGDRLAMWMKATQRLGREKEEEEYDLDLLRKAAELGHVNAMQDYAHTLKNGEKWKWLYRAMEKEATITSSQFVVHATHTMNQFVSQMHKMHKFGGLTDMYELGKVIHEHNVYILAQSFKLKQKQTCSIYKARHLYLAWSNRARGAVLTWFYCAQKLGITRDVARLTSALIWDGRKTDYFRSDDLIFL
jgi:hypothetical protein